MKIPLVLPISIFFITIPIGFNRADKTTIPIQQLMKTIENLKSKLIDAAGELNEAQLEKGNVEVKLNETDLEKLNDGFLCAMEKFKTFNDRVFGLFGLRNKKRWAIEEDDALPWPEDMYELIESSDFYLDKDRKRSSIVTVKLTKKDVGYTKWLLFTQGDENRSSKPEILLYAEPLRKKLKTYYESHKTEIENQRPPQSYRCISNMTSFHQYFAATMQRFYLLGCLWEEGLKAKFPSSQLDENKDFIKLFQELLPLWNLKRVDIDMLNIAWKIGGVIADNEKLLVGYNLPETDKRHEEAIIPAFHHCHE